jgi:hypothetical protein
MKKSFGRIIAWTKKHPWVAALIVGGVVFLAWLAYKRNAAGGGGEESAVTVSQTPGGAAGEAVPAAASPEFPNLTPGEPIDIGYEIPSFGGGGFGGGGGGGGGGGAISAGSLLTASAPAPLDTSMFDNMNVPMISRQAADQFFAGLSPESETMTLFNKMVSRPEPVTGEFSGPGGRSAFGGAVTGGTKSIKSGVGSGKRIDRAASQKETLPPTMQGPKPAPLTGPARTSGGIKSLGGGVGSKKSTTKSKAKK